MVLLSAASMAVTLVVLMVDLMVVWKAALLVSLMAD
jgi:hypothetical protein